MILAKNTNTPMSFFLGVPLCDLCGWIVTNNEVVADERGKQ